MTRSLLTILAVLVADQVSKFWVKTTMLYNESIPVIGEKFMIHFIENPGMAFGMEFGGDLGKLALSVLRVIAVILLLVGLMRSIRKGSPKGFQIALSLIIAGAVGNIIDSAFYGMIFSESSRIATAEFLPEGGGYAGFMHGHVVDMLHFPLFRGEFPSWFPFWGGEPFLFFRPVFNIADSSITVGVFWIILRSKTYLGDDRKEPPSRDMTEESHEVERSGEAPEQPKANTDQSSSNS